MSDPNPKHEPECPSQEPRAIPCACTCGRFVPGPLLEAARDLEGIEACYCDEVIDNPCQLCRAEVALRKQYAEGMRHAARMMRYRGLAATAEDIEQLAREIEESQSNG